MKDNLGREVQLGDFIMYAVRGSTHVAIKYGRVFGFCLNSYNEQTMQVQSVVKWGDTLRIQGNVTLTTAANFIIINDLYSDLFTEIKEMLK